MKKTIIVCDSCGNEINNGHGVLVTAKSEDKRRGTKRADFCERCADALLHGEKPAPVR